MARYRFLTRWIVDAPIEAVFDALLRVEDWPSWWRGLRRVTLVERGDDRGIGAVHRFVFRSALPYSLAFDVEVTGVEAPVMVTGRAHGELEGVGTWTLRDGDGRTRVAYAWDVRTTRWWMNALAPIARPVFVHNHDVVMEWGREGLGRRLGAAVSPDDSTESASLW